MGKRMMAPTLWEEEWFLDLPDNYKLLYLYIKNRCDGAGVWRINRRMFGMVSKMPLHLDDFINAVNKDEDGVDGKADRITQLDNRRLWLNQFINEEYGSYFRRDIGAHRGMIRLVLIHKIPLAKIPNFDFGYLQDIDNQQLMIEAHAKGNFTPTKPHATGTTTPRERERERERKRERELVDNIEQNENFEDSPDQLQQPGEPSNPPLPPKEIYGNPRPQHPFDWEAEKEKVRQDREWKMRMQNNHRKSEREIDDLLEVFFGQLEDNKGKKVADDMCSHFNYWVPKRERALEAEKNNHSNVKVKNDTKNIENMDYSRKIER